MYDYKSSNAKKLNYNDFEYKSSPSAALKSDVKTSVSEKAVKEKTQKKAGISPLAAFLTVLLFAASFLTVKGYVEIYEADNRISELKEDLRMIEAENQAVKAKVDKSVDLKNLQKTASEKFGMVRPESYQIFYVDLDFGDYSENIKKENAEKKEATLYPEGVTGVLISSANMFK